MLRSRGPERNARGPLACVIGDMDLVRPLGLAGIRCAVAGDRGSPAMYSRFTRAVVEWTDSWGSHALLERLMTFGASQLKRPVLYYQGDRDLLLVSRHREQLREVFRLVIPDAELIEDLVDKARFQVLAERLTLPVPASRPLLLTESTPPELDLVFPLIVKPLTRAADTWDFAAGAKAVKIESRGHLQAVWPRLREAGTKVLAQELIPGPETMVESYHTYVDDRGELVGEFTGRKIRTHPRAYGHSTAVEITDQPDVMTLGRELVHRLGLRGVAKLDFKRDPAGCLRLLEINPRFTLWHPSRCQGGRERARARVPRPSRAAAGNPPASPSQGSLVRSRARRTSGA